MLFFSKKFKVGDRVIYRKPKKSESPSPNAINLWPERTGDSYRYTIKKYWAVVQVDGDRIQVVTRRGKHHWMNVRDPLLRKASWYECWFREDNFPMVDPKTLALTPVRENEIESHLAQKTSEEELPKKIM